MKIAVFIDAFYGGGAEMAAIRLANRLVKDHEVFFVGFLDRPELRTDVEKLDSGITIYHPYNTQRDVAGRKVLSFFRRFGLRVNPKSYFYGQKLKRLRMFLQNKRVSVINSHAIECNDFFDTYLNGAYNPGLVLTLHGFYELYKEQMPKDRFEVMIRNHFKKVSAAVYTTKEQYNTLLGYGFDFRKMYKINYGFDLSLYNVTSSLKWSGKNDVQFNIVLVSRGIAEKGWFEAVEAAHLLQQNGFNIQLWLVGDGDAYKQLSKRDFPAYIKLLGRTAHVFPILQKAHLGILPSYYFSESFPNSVIEYLAAGLPVVATDIGSIKEMMSSDNGLAGTVITGTKGTPVQVQDLYAAIKAIIQDGDLYGTYAQNALLAAEKFSINKVSAEYNLLFDKVSSLT